MEVDLAADGSVMAPFCLCSDDLPQTAVTWYLNTATSSKRLALLPAVWLREGGLPREDTEAHLLVKGRA